MLLYIMIPPTLCYNYFILLILFCHHIGRNVSCLQDTQKSLFFISKNTNKEVAMKESFQPKLVLISFYMFKYSMPQHIDASYGPISQCSIPACWPFFSRLIGKKMPKRQLNSFFLQAYLDNDLLFKKYSSRRRLRRFLLNQF